MQHRQRVVLQDLPVNVFVHSFSFVYFGAKKILLLLKGTLKEIQLLEAPRSLEAGPSQTLTVNE